MATEKQKNAVIKMAENGGNVSKAMRDAGYAETTAQTPQKLTESEGFKELCEQYLPDHLLVKIHKEGLQATAKKPQLIDRDDKGRPIYDYVEEKDYATRHKYLETAYKIKGKVKEGDSNVQVNFINHINAQREKYGL